MVMTMFARLAAGRCGRRYVDVARDPNFGRPGIIKFLEDPSLEHPPFAPPFPKAGDFIFGKKVAYVDLSLFQMIEGLRYAFPKITARLELQHPRLATLHDRVMTRRPNRRLPKPHRAGCCSTSKAFSATIQNWKTDDAKEVRN
jgi:hypothetical protein